MNAPVKIRRGDLQPGQCRHAIDEDARGSLYCGQPVRAPGGKHCEACHRRVYRLPPLASEGLHSADTPSPAAVAIAKTPPQPAPDVPASLEPAEGMAIMATPDDPARGNLRSIAAIDLRGEALWPIASGEPIFERVDPRELLVDETYQRDLSPASMKLIQKIATGWDWRKFKPPVVALADGGLQIIDGQHTAIGAACRPDIDKIPVMIVEAAELQARAQAFIGHNKDRLAVPAIRIHHAAVAAGDEDAATIEQVCQRAGVVLVRSAYGGRKWRPGETIALSAIAGLIDRRGALRARQMLQVLVAAELAPIKPHHMRAVEAIFTDPLYAPDVDALDQQGADDLTSAIKTLGEGAEREARLYIDARNGVPMWKALAMQWFKKMRKRRKAA